MDKYIKKIQPKHYGIVAFLLTCISTYMMLSYEQVLSTGRFVFTEGDTLTQYVPFVKMLLRNLLEGESLWYSWSMSMGQNTSLSMAFFIWNPFNLLYIIFPFFDEAVVTAMLFILKTGLAALFFQRFACKVLQCHGIESIVFSIFYALCSYNVIYNVLTIMWVDALYLLPLICEKIYTLNKEGKWKGLLAVHAFLLISQTYMAYVVGIFSFLYMMLTCLCYTAKENKAKILIKYFGTVVLAFGISSIAWFPALMFLLSNNAQSVAEFKDLRVGLTDIIYNLSWGQMQGVEGIYPYIYCGIPTVILSIFYFINKKISIKEKICAGILFVFLFASMLYMPLYKFMHAYDSPDMLGFRFAYLLSFLMCAIACRQSKFIKEISLKVFGSVVGGIVLIYVGLFVMQVNKTLSYKPPMWSVVIGNLLFLIIWIVVFIFAIKKSIKPVSCAILIFFISIIEVTSNGYATYMVMGPDVLERNYIVYRDSIETGVALIEDDDFYRVRYMNDYIYNSDSWFDYNGISDFSSDRNIVLQETMASLGHYACRNIISNVGNTPVTDMLFGIKYIINGVNPYILAVQMPEPTVENNMHALSLGYMVEEDVLTYQFASLHVFDNMDALIKTMTGENIDCFENVPLDSVVINVENAWYESAEDGIRVGKISDNDEDGYIYYTIPSQEGKVAYVQFQTLESVPIPNAPILMGGEENSVSEKGYLTVSYAKKLSEVNGGVGVTILFSEDVMPVTRYQQANFCYYNEEALINAYNILSQNQMIIREYGNTYIDAYVTVPEERTVLFTSIPYDEGWTVWVDGIETETKAVVGEAFLALELEPGYHDLKFRYEAPGAQKGMAISSISVGLYVGIILIEYLIKRNRKAKEGKMQPNVEDRTK